MEELLKKAMEDGENLLWSARPEKFETLDRTYKPIFLRKLIISLLVGVIFTVGYILLARKNGVALKWGVVAVVWVFCALSPVGIFRDAKALAKNTVYGITDKRLITVANTDAIRTVPYDKLEQAALYTDEDGHTSLICGRANGKTGGNLREAALSAVSMSADEEKCDRFVMYAVPQSDKLRKLLSEHVTVK